jgi:adenosylmethionine---8-amino-7-oxononanoate aminotransferase
MDWSHIWFPYTQMKTAPPPLAVQRTEGVRLHLADGRTLIDGTSSWWTACHGYNHPAMVSAIATQLEAMPHVMLGGLVHAPAAELSSRLASLLPGSLERVFFSESGSVAVEVAMKIAIQYWIQHGDSGRTKFLSFLHGYHGDTFAAMSICDPEEGMHTLFAGVVPMQVIVPLPRDEAGFAALDRTLARHRHELAAVVLEPLLQAAGGMKFHEPEVLARIAGLARRHGVLLILDEIATGFGRTGTMFACEQADVVPDVITLSKALTGGTLPLAATVATQEVYAAFHSDDAARALMHGPTFTGNPLACAAALASLALFGTEPRLAGVAAIAEALAQGLEPARQLSGVRDVRVLGAVGVVQLARVPDTRMLNELRQRFVAAGVWVRPFGDVVYLMPPLVMERDDLDRLTAAVVSVLGGLPA